MARLGCISIVLVLGLLAFVMADHLEPVIWYTGVGTISVGAAYMIRSGKVLIASRIRQGEWSWRNSLAAGVVGLVLAGFLGFCVVVALSLHEYQVFSYPKAVDLCYADVPEAWSEQAEGRAICILLFVLPAGFLAGLGYRLLAPARRQGSGLPD